MNINTKSKNLESGSDEVEEMLREAQDAMLLKLSVGSHMARLSSNLPPDLESRFQGLKSGPSTNRKPEKSTPKVTSCDTTKVRDQCLPVLSGNDDDDDNLFARFAALKASMPQPSTSTSLSEHIKPENANQTSGLNSTSSSAAMEESSVDESEVEKIIQWAIDAARLDPSPPSDDDNDVDSTSNDDNDVDNTSNDDNVSESESSDEEDDKLKKGKRRVCK